MLYPNSDPLLTVVVSEPTVVRRGIIARVPHVAGDCNSN